MGHPNDTTYTKKQGYMHILDLEIPPPLAGGGGISATIIWRKKLAKRRERGERYKEKRTRRTKREI
jgi:hypothetical protein